MLQLSRINRKRRTSRCRGRLGVAAAVGLLVLALVTPSTALAQPPEDTEAQTLDAVPAAQEQARVDELVRSLDGTPRAISRSLVATMAVCLDSDERPCLTVDKKTNGEDHLGEIPMGGHLHSVQWTYLLTNHTDFTMIGIGVLDLPEGLVDCPSSELSPHTSMTCKATGFRVEGEYINRALAFGFVGTQLLAIADDSSSYTGFPSCRGERATLFAIPGQVTTGTDGVDVILGTPGDDEIYGLGGDDIICPSAGDDFVDGGSGDDTIDNREVLFSNGDVDLATMTTGNNRFLGGSGDDRITGGEGDDQIDGGNGNDRLYGSFGNDVLRGEGGNDNLQAGPGSDILIAGPGDDEAFDGVDNDPDRIFGGLGNDRLGFNGGFDWVHGGPGDDVIEPSWAFPGPISDAADLIGGSGADIIVGGDGNDRLRGGQGSDRLDGRVGADHVDGGNDQDPDDCGSDPSDILLNCP